jgi:hypothetical protein
LPVALVMCTTAMTRRARVQVASGRYKKQKVIQCAAMSREALFNKLTDAVARGYQVRPAMQPTHGPHAS